MSKAVRVGDSNTAGGIVIQGHSNVLINGRPAAKMYSKVTPHPCCPKKKCAIHCGAWVIGPGATDILVNGLPMVKTGDLDLCMHSRITGSSNVKV
jgi:uncharacterized Zn-binding protein involved in type VI secretion